MHIFSVFASVLVLTVLSVHALAESQPFCERVAKDFAHANAADVDKWLADYRSAFETCMAQNKAAINADTPVEKPVVKSARKSARKVVIAPARTTDMISGKRSTLLRVPGSIEWNNYCAAKHASFNRLTGFYRSKNGKERRCIDTLN